MMFHRARTLIQEFKGDGYVHGLGVLPRAGALATQLGRRAVVVRDTYPGFDSAVASLVDSLRAAGVDIAGIVPGAAPNAPLEDLHRITGELQRLEPDVLVSFGGGSTIDCTKAAEVASRLPAVRSAGKNNFDIPVLKTTAVTERSRMQFRAESFNTMNHPEYSSPRGAPGSANTFSRQLQLGLKLRWQIMLPILAFWAILCAPPAEAAFVLASPAAGAAILVPPEEPRYLRIAANDLVTDVRRITGRTLPIVLVPEACAGGCVVLASVSVPASRAVLSRFAPDLAGALQGKPEAFHIRTSGNMLLIAGADPRGTMWGLYDFIEKELGVDPMYQWTGLLPAPRPELSWPSIDRGAASPSFRLRGWFINDEDLLTEWRDGGGPRHIDYPFYAQVTAPEVLDRVFETMLRLKFNLVIPASFTDIANPAEERMVEAATRRGLYVSMHHVEPMGVSAFAFSNYWRARALVVC